MVKKIIRILVVLIAAFAIFVFCTVVSVFIPRHGQATHVSDLKGAFSKAGPWVEATFTNSLIQSFPFDGGIEWRLTLFKDPFLSLNGRVDTNALLKFVRANPDTRFFWSGTGSNGQNWSADGWPTKEEYPSVNWTTMSFYTPHTNQFGADIDVTFDIISNRVHFLIH
jgi:hypothetical protein